METCAAVTEVRVLDGYRLELLFDDGLRGVVDLADLITGRHGVFEQLHDPKYFTIVSVNEELGTIVWPNGADFCPDVLHEWVQGGVLQPAR